MNPLLVDGIGYSALVLNLYAMSTKGEHRLRLMSAIANFAYIIYGILLNAIPIIVGCTIAVILHLYRLNALNVKEEHD
jgi:hypothetical protein